MEQPKSTLPNNERGYREARKSYLTATRWSRAAIAAFWVIFAAFVVWAVPVFPWGMSRDDYSAEVLLGLLLLGCCPGVTAIALLARSIAVQRREALVAWTAIYDRTTGLRNREFFLERLRLQRDLGHDLEEYQAGLMLLSIEVIPGEGHKPQPASDEVFRSIGTHIARQLRPNDLPAAISATELAVLVSQGSKPALDAIASRIEHSLRVRIRGLVGEIAERVVIRIGHASLDGADTEPETVLETARARLRIVYPEAEETAAA